MTKQSKKSSHKNLLLIIAILVVCAGIATWWFWHVANANTSDTSSTSSNATSSSNTAGGTSKDDASAATSQSNQTTEQIPTASTGSVTITKLAENNGYVTAAAEVTNFSTTQCVYTFTKDGSRPVVREVSGSCSEVSIPAAEFEMIGAYTLTINVYNGSEKLTTSQDISVQ